MVKMILTDGDGTLWQYDNHPFKSGWDALTRAFSEEQRERWFLVRNFYLQQENAGKYTKWFTSQLSMLEGVSLESVCKFLFPIPYSPGAKEFFSSLDGRYKKGIVSSGINIVADRAKEELGMDISFSNILETNEGYFTGKGELVLGLDEKGELVKKIADEHKIHLSDICFIGDNDNDLPALEIVGHPFVINPKDKRLEGYNQIEDFTQLKYFL